MPTVYTPPVSTYVPLATITLASTDSEIVFSSIPATYRDLVVVFNGTASAAAGYYVTFNSTSTTDYSRVAMFADSGGAISFTSSNSLWIEAGTGQSTTLLNVMDYSATDKHKTILSRSNVTGTVVAAFAGRWANTSAVTSIHLFRSPNTWSAGSTFSLYGIAS